MTGAGAAESETEWSNAEETLLRIFRPMWPSNFCQLAKIIATKSCVQVGLYSSSNLDITPRLGSYVKYFLRSDSNTGC